MGLTPMQEETLEWMATHPKGMIPLPVGQGKTLIALKFIEWVGQPALIVSTKSILERTWPSEIKLWDLPLSYACCAGPKKIREAALASKPAVLGVSFENLVWYYQQKDPVERTILFIDESSKMKDRGTTRVQTQLRKTKGFTWAYALSGTPSPESVMDIWAQFACLMIERPVGNITEFRRRFFDAILEGDGTHVKYEIRPGALIEISKCYRPYFFKPPPEKISDFGIPAPRYIEIRIPWGSDEDYALYRKMAKEMCLFEGVEYDDADLLEAESAGVLQNKLRQMASGFMYSGEETAVFPGFMDKANALVRFMERIDGKPLLCFAQFDEELEQIERVFPEAQFGLPDDLDEWDAKEIPLMILHPKSASHGLNLQAGSNHILFYSLPWSGQDFEQSIGRIHRRGQKNQVTVARFTREGSIEMRMFTELQRKIRQQIETVNALGEGGNG